MDMHDVAIIESRAETPLPSAEVLALDERSQRTHRRFCDFLRAIDALIADPLVEDIMINRHNQIFFERAGVMGKWDGADLDKEALRGAISVAASAARTSVGLSAGNTPVVDAQLGNFRIAAAIDPISHGGASMTIRKHRSVRFTPEEYLASGGFAHLGKGIKTELPTFNREMTEANILAYLRELMSHGVSVLVSGTPSGGKSSFLGVLASLIPPHKRVVVMEDTHELKLPLPNCLTLITHPPTGTTMRRLVAHSLRSNAQVLIMGEIRGAEAADFVNAINSGPKALATLHADGPLDALRKLESLALQANEGNPHDALRQQIASCVDVVVHMARVGGQRAPVAAIRVNGYRDQQYVTSPLFATSN